MFDIIGDVVILKPPFKEDPKEMAKKILEKHKFVRTILVQKTDALPPFRVPEYEVIYGDGNTETIHKEYGMRFKTDVFRAYYSPRLGNERMRIVKQVQDKERVLVMFAGVNPYAIAIAKHANPEIVYTIEWNPIAVKYGLENVKLNKVQGKVITLLGDVREVSKIISFLEDASGVISLDDDKYINLVMNSDIKFRKLVWKTKERDVNSKENWKWIEEDEKKVILERNGERIEVKKYNMEFDRIIMPLPKEADTFLDSAIPLIKEGGVIHLYQFFHEKEIPNKANEILDKYSEELGFEYDILRVVKAGDIAPRQYRVCIDFRITKKL